MGSAQSREHLPARRVTLKISAASLPPRNEVTTQEGESTLQPSQLLVSVLKLPDAKGRWFRDRQLVTHLMHFPHGEGGFEEKSAPTDFAGSCIFVTGGIRLALVCSLETPILDIT